MSERKKFYKKFLPMLIIFLLPFAFIFFCAELLPHWYGDTFLGELSEKYERLRSIDEPKITVVSGSSSAFGLDSGMIEEKLGMKAVNLGLYANLGSKLTVDLARENINPGDIIVLAPELNAETYSLYFGAETFAQALDGNLGMIKSISSENRAEVIGAAWGLAGSKLNYLISGERPENVGAYRKENFNEYGDNVFDRPYSVLNGCGNPVILSFSGSDEFYGYTEYLNGFAEYAEKKGAKVFFSFPPVNSEAILPFNSEEEIINFQKTVALSLDFPVISSLENYIMDPGYFYDSEFHLNNSGVTVRTVKLIDDIKRQLGDQSITLPASSLPSPSGKRPDCEDFDLIRLSSANSRAWAVEKVSESGAEKSYLSIPDEVSGNKVVGISAGAFEGCRAEIITLGLNITKIDSGAFENAENLAGIVLPDGSEPGEVTFPGGTGNGCADGFKIYVPSDKFVEFYSDEKYENVRDILAPNESFEYEISGGEAKIVSLTETGLMRKELIIPDEASGAPITSLAPFALYGSEAEKIVCGKNVKNIAENAFADTVSGLEIRLPEGTEIILPEDPISLGGSPVIFAYSEDYASLSEKYPEYKEVLTADNLYFEMELENGSWTVTGVNPAGAELTELTVPDYADGYPVRTVAGYAFRGSKAKVLYLGNGVSRLDGYALSDSELERVVIPEDRLADEISVPNNMSEALACEGAGDGFRIEVGKDSYQGFISDYFWGDYGRWVTARE